MEIRSATIGDAAELLDIYSHYVENTAISFEYVPPTLDEFKNRIENISKKYPYLVATVDGKIIGYAYAASFHSREAFKFCVEVSIYISRDYHGHGVGRALYEKLEELLKKQNVRTLYACIAVCDKEDGHLPLGSVAFHEKMGYITVGSHPNCGYKFGKWYGVVWMEKRLAGCVPEPEAFIPFPLVEG